jgi:CRP-like cAMP-binding protein
MTKEPGEFLVSIAPFDALPPEAARDLQRYSFEKHFQRADIIFAEGSASRTVWIVKEGRVHLQKLHPDGKVSTVCIIQEGDLLCCLPVLDLHGCPATAVAKVPSNLIGIPAEAFSKLIARYPTFSQRVIAIVCRCLRQVEEMADSHTYESAEKRVVRALLMLEKKFGPEIHLTREEIAELCGLTVETAIRMTSRLKNKELLCSSVKKSLRVDAEKLRAYLESLNMI